VRYLLEHGADPNRQSRWGWYPLHHALTRNNRLPIIQLLFDHGADPQKVSDGLTAVALAARVGRADVLALMAPHGAGTHHAPQDTEGSGTPLALQGVDRLLALCAEGDTSAAKALLQDDPTLLPALLDIGGTCLAKFATSANLAGVTTLLDIGVAVDAPFTKGDPYFGTPAGSLSIHVAASHSQPAIVRLLLARGAAPDTPDANGDTPLLLAVRACVDSYWKYRRTPEAVEALLQAGASAARVPYPCGYDAVDALLAQFRQ
jgi:ankyrin repeat protein